VAVTHSNLERDRDDRELGFGQKHLSECSIGIPNRPIDQITSRLPAISVSGAEVYKALIKLADPKRFERSVSAFGGRGVGTACWIEFDRIGVDFPPPASPMLPRKIRADGPAAVIPNFPLFSKRKMVGATRIELVTPTMST
jgi:hypothetical protein